MEYEKEQCAYFVSDYSATGELAVSSRVNGGRAKTQYLPALFTAYHQFWWWFPIPQPRNGPIDL